ncbi:hypothetical protein [Synechococcus sp. MU1642]|uniref:hypothetical protein n=1 Tax=Synechococcus sp. MU1642 TaxID=2508348 RepID=UPI001CF8C58C|nr:hypothetical protein [Synechococcus sp. MU1642]MCB4407783.1 hypothetical protein [Synechococcus sp. MU1642]
MIAVVFWILCGVFASTIAGGKGHGGCSWFLGGILFGPLALIATLGLRDRKRDWDTQKLINTQEEMLDEIQRKHAWDRQQWEQEKERQYLEAESRRDDDYRLPPEQEEEEWDEEPGEGEVIDVSTSEEDSLDDYLHTLEYDEDVPGLLEKLSVLGMETKAEFLYRLKWNVEVPENQVAEQLFAEHIWKEVLNKSDDTDYQEFWEKELAQSFLVVRTQDNAYFLKRVHG